MPNIHNAEKMAAFLKGARSEGFAISDDNVRLCETVTLEQFPIMTAVPCGNCWLFAYAGNAKNTTGAPYVACAVFFDSGDFEDWGVYTRDEVYGAPYVFLPNGYLAAAQREKQLLLKGILSKSLCAVGQPVHAGKRGFSCIGRCATVNEDGKCATFTLPDGSIEKREDWQALGKGYCNSVPDDMFSGWAAMWEATKSAPVHKGYWAANNALHRYYTKTVGWRKTLKGRVVLPKTGTLHPKDPEDPLVLEAVRNGLQEARGWSPDGIRHEAAVDTCEGLVRPSAAFTRWATKEKKTGFKAEWGHALAYEKAVVEFSL